MTLDRYGDPNLISPMLERLSSGFYSDFRGEYWYNKENEEEF
jgi:hypothetical protein